MRARGAPPGLRRPPFYAWCAFAALAGVTLYGAWSSTPPASTWLLAATISASSHVAGGGGAPHPRALNGVFPNGVVPPSFEAPSALLRVGRAANDSSDPHVSLIVADAFLAASCIKLMSVVECGAELDFTQLQVEVRGLYRTADCGGGGSDTCVEPPYFTRPRGPLTRLKVRDLWEWTTEGELCAPELAGAARADVTLYYGPASKPLSLTRVPDTPKSDVALMLIFRSDLFITPTWLNFYAASGVGHFYLYYNGALTDMQADNAVAFAALHDDPRVTLVQWPLMFFQPGATHDFVKGVCSGHFAQMLAFNDAFQRYRWRHAYMGFFDFDEYLIVPRPPGAPPLDNPIMDVLARYNYPLVLSVMNRWGAILPTLPDTRTLVSPVTALRHTFYGGAYLSGRTRSKYFVRTTNYSFELCLGNHDVFALNKVRRVRGTEVWSGNGYEKESNAQATRSETRDAYFLHVLNLRPHHSTMTFNEDEAIAHMVGNRSVVGEVGEMLGRAVAPGFRRRVVGSLVEHLC